MNRVTATPSSFTIGTFTIKNATLNFSDVFFIQKIKHQPIGTDLSLFAICFENLDAKNHYWHYPDQATRDADFDKLDSITHFAGSPDLDPNASTKAKQEELILKVQQLIDKPERSDIVFVGIDSFILNQIDFDTASHSTFGVGGGQAPTIVQDTQTPNLVSWTSISPNHLIIIPFDHNFQATKICAYFEFESHNQGIDANRFDFFFREVSPIIIPPTITSKVFPANDKKQIIELKFDNTITSYSNLEIVIQPHYLTNTNYPATYSLRSIGFLPTTFSSTDLIKQQLVFENSILTTINYLDVNNQPYTLKELFIPDSNFPVEKNNTQLLKELIEAVKKSDYEKVLVADDYTPTAVVLDLGQPNERLESITHTSPTLGISIKETFNYLQRPDGSYLALPPTRTKL